MRKPTFPQFLLMYLAAFITVHAWVWTQYPSRYPFLTASMVNMAFVCINLIGVMFAATGFAPWRDSDPEPDEPAATGKQKISRMMTQGRPQRQIVVDSSAWTGR